MRRERIEDQQYEERELRRCLEAEPPNPLESWGLSSASAAELTSVSDSANGALQTHDETELRIDTDFERMLAEDKGNDFDLEGRIA